MHSLLRRQLVRFFNQAETIPEYMRGFVKAVNNAYHQFDDDRSMLERSLEMSSQELLQANSDMRAIFQVLPDLFFRLDSEGIILDCKAGSETDFYTNPKSLLGKRIQDIPIPEVSTKFDQAVQKLKHIKLQVNVEYSLRIQDRKIFYEARFLPLPDNEIIANIRDITERKNAEKELRSREELLSATLESTADGIMVVDKNGFITHSNARFAEMWRIPREHVEMRNTSLFLKHALIQLKDRRAFLSRIRELYRRPDVAFDTLLFKDGRFIELVAYPLNNEGEVAGRVLSFRDVTEQKVAEGRVACLNQLKERLLGPGDLGDKLHFITETVVNALKVDFARIWVSKPGDLCDSGCFHGAPANGPHICPSHKRCLHLLASSGRYTHLDGKVHCRVPFGCYKIGKIASGTEQGFLTNDVANDVRVHDHEWASKLGLVSFAGQRVLSANGEPIGVLAFFSKNTISNDEFAFGEALASTASQVIQTAIAEEQRRDLQQKLDRAERMESLGILAGGVAHDLNNMLGPLVGYPELILMKLPEDSPVRKQVERVGNAARDAADVIQDLLTLARRGRYEMQPTDLNMVARSYFESPSFTQLCNRFRDVSVKTKLCESLPLITGSSAHLSKVIMNLVVNAFDAMSRGGILDVETSIETLSRLQSGYDNVVPGDYACLKVCDTGIGIAEEDLAKIFEPYYSKKRMGTSGSGLGLSVVYGVVKDHHGYYDIISEVGKGTEFAVYFPICKDMQSKPGPDLNIQGGTETILVIDDSTEQREFAFDVLSSLGYEVITKENGTEGLCFLREHRVDLIMLDMIMESGFDGLDTYREIIKLHPGQKAIIVSGFAATDRVELAQQLGAGAYIKKPYTRQTIAAAVRQELDKVPIASQTNQLSDYSISC
jgi:PAS domain S-box-containing protein